MIEGPIITEVLPEPGCRQLWVSFDNGLTHRVDLTLLLLQPTYQALQLRKLYERATVSSDGLRLEWPGGAWIGREEVLGTPDGDRPLRTMARLPYAQRFRPLWPYLRHLDLPVYLRPEPIEAVAVVRLLQLKPGELETACRMVHAPAEVMQGRLYDVGILLQELFSPEGMTAMLRRPWRLAAEQLPGQPLQSTMLGCLLYGRPDLVEWPCVLLASRTPQT